jgi:predicted metal-dependent hydrolase
MLKPKIVIIGRPDWAESIRAQLAADYEVVLYDEPTHYVRRLTDARAALILVDSQDTDWRFWTTTPKSNNATRRIPVLVVADSPALRRDALLSGADLSLASDNLEAQIGRLVRDYARVESTERIAQLDCECDEALPDLARQGVEKFNAGEYYKQHDLFEELWMATDGPVRDLYRAILQVGVAYYQIERGNAVGALKMLLRSVQWLLILPDTCQGIDVRQLREDSFRVRAELEALDPDAIADFDRRLLQPVHLVSES